MDKIFRELPTDANGIIQPPMPKVIAVRNPTNGELLKVQPLFDFLTNEIGNEPAEEVAKMVRHTAKKGSEEDVRELLSRVAKMLEKMTD